MTRGLPSRARRLAAAVSLVLTAALAGPLAAHASQADDHNPHGRLLGVARAVQPGLGPRLSASSTEPPLTYHGGSVVHDGHVYAIFWEPPGFAFPPDYKSGVLKYFIDLAADGGRRTSVYSASRQYRDGVGAASDHVSFGGSYTATDSLPASGCSDPGASVCLTDAQVTHELAARGLPGGLDKQYFVFTPPGVGSCFDPDGSACAYTLYCAYHSWFYSQGAPLLYAVHPFVAGVETCDMGQSPTGTSADAVLNVVSHEHNEIITDPTGHGWFDLKGEENGDKCAWKFGATQGPPGGIFNQALNGAGYLLQEEWSNQDGGCVQASANRRPSASFAYSGRPVARLALPFAASAWDSDGRVVSYAWKWGDGHTGHGRKRAHTYGKAGKYKVRLTVTDDEGGTAGKTHTVTVAPRKR